MPEPKKGFAILISRAITVELAETAMTRQLLHNNEDYISNLRGIAFIEYDRRLLPQVQRAFVVHARSRHT